MTSDEPGGRIHSTDPFAVPETEKSQVRRLRGRFAATVTLWTAPGPAGLTVSSAMIADGEPGRVLGLIDEESDFWEAANATGRFAVTALGDGDQQLADRFAGLLPAPGGVFATGAWTDTDFGPVPAGAGTWAGCRLENHRPCGWAMLVVGAIETTHLDSGSLPLMHYRGRYRHLGPLGAA
jgi:3-hydroxy-9,10-secoandrosta-1,3,5(10)-triene-9,17-dione monooxygenase reductase component